MHMVSIFLQCMYTEYYAIIIAIGDWKVTPKCKDWNPPFVWTFHPPPSSGLLGWGSQLPNLLLCCIRSHSTLEERLKFQFKWFLRSAETSELLRVSGSSNGWFAVTKCWPLWESANMVDEQNIFFVKPVRNAMACMHWYHFCSGKIHDTSIFNDNQMCDSVRHCQKGISVRPLQLWARLQLPSNFRTKWCFHTLDIFRCAVDQLLHCLFPDFLWLLSKACFTTPVAMSNFECGSVSST